MATSATGGQAVAIAAAVAKKHGCSPREVGEKHLEELQLELWRSGQYLPQTSISDPDNLLNGAQITASSTLELKELTGSTTWKPIEHSVAQMLPVKGNMPAATVWVEASQATELFVDLRKSSKPFNHTPDVTLETRSYRLIAGKHELVLDWDSNFPEECYAFVCFLKNEHVKIQYSEQRVTGLVTVFNATNPAVSNYGKQEPTEDLGVDTFEFWCPQRRPAGLNLAFKLSEPIQLFGTENLRNGWHRPIAGPNAWVAAQDDRHPELAIQWNELQYISKIDFVFDTDFDHPMENVIYVHPETVMPFCAQDIEVLDDTGNVIGTINDNHLTKRTLTFSEPIATHSLKIRLQNSHMHLPVSLMEVRVY
jgi:hypothetical protein